MTNLSGGAVNIQFSRVHQRTAGLCELFKELLLATVFLSFFLLAGVGFPLSD